jgi:hypothetical protein
MDLLGPGLHPPWDTMRTSLPEQTLNLIGPAESQIGELVSLTWAKYQSLLRQKLLA